ncbi:hypothetical protein RchiOBHm_Chr2g0171781 [Rosa chinensis]|uniref:Uncharacterized protein n=1 Tax=Rosa chinensis TaxID=74649 RepID=A0A2P6S5G5_ROSCH|nr:hypothetical protein RchiOBHm_Chr2g0171781 [Rosa chinensis]
MEIKCIVDFENCSVFHYSVQKIYFSGRKENRNFEIWYGCSLGVMFICWNFVMFRCIFHFLNYSWKLLGQL